MLDPIDYELTHINTRKAWFKSIFKKDADENLDLFLQYLAEETNRQLTHELNEFNERFKELKDSGFFDS